MTTLDLIESWMPKGELCYFAKKEGHDWKDIRRVCPDGYLLAMRWAKRNGAKWPLEDGGVVEPSSPVEVEKGAEVEPERHWEPMED